MLKIILYPFSLLVNAIVFCRNYLYDRRFFRSEKPPIFSINVGNLNLGGTGKTPHVEYLVKLLSPNFQTSILSRGYKRKTKGFLLADQTTTAEKIGDEPMQYYLKFSPQTKVVVCEDRLFGIEKIKSLFPDNQLVILDDAFQHRKISPQINLLLCDYNRPFYDDFLFPAGRLRDRRQSAKRADAIIVSKCPDMLTNQEKDAIKNKLQPYILAHTPVFFSHILYQSVEGYDNNTKFDKNLSSNIVTAIAKPNIFIDYLRSIAIKINQISDFPDHFSFSRKEIDAIGKETRFFSSISQILTTEKDMVKIKPLLREEELKHFFYVPIEIMLENRANFEAFILNRIKKNDRQ